MEGPFFLTLDEVLQLHSYQIQDYGGDPAILNIELLHSPTATNGLACTQRSFSLS